MLFWTVFTLVPETQWCWNTRRENFRPNTLVFHAENIPRSQLYVCPRYTEGYQLIYIYNLVLISSCMQSSFINVIAQNILSSVEIISSYQSLPSLT